MAELDAHVPSFIDGARGRSSRAVRSHTTRPVRRSIARIVNRWTSRGRTWPLGSCEAAPEAPIGIAVETNSRSPHTTGDDEPRPGISVFHRMFFVSLHSTGGSAVLETPFAYGPRHWGQNRSATGSAASSTNDSSAALVTAASPATWILVSLMVFSLDAPIMGRRGAAVKLKPPVGTAGLTPGSPGPLGLRRYGRLSFRRTKCRRDKRPELRIPARCRRRNYFTWTEEVKPVSSLG